MAPERENKIPLLSPFSSRLHEEIEDFFQFMVPTAEEHATRLAVIGRIRDAICGLWPKAKVEVFGSFRTGLYLPTR